jgi:uncharacterized protein (TIGR01777 family)
MKVLVSGSSGFIGSSLVSFLKEKRAEVVRLVRSQPNPGEAAVFWDPEKGNIENTRLKGLDAVVHLAGESIIGRWTAGKKAKILNSRKNGTRLLAESLARLDRKPKVLICASAIGYYGDRGEEILKEESPAGKGFLPEVCLAWEGATQPAAEAGIRVVNLRIGMVLSPKGGALAKMAPPFKMGLGGKIGSGRQYVSWISMGDLLGIFQHALATESLRGPVNAVAPNPVTNLEFTKTLGRVLSRPTLFPMPAFAARLAFGEMSNELFLASTRVIPSKLLETGFQFRHMELESALRELLGKT